jgi:hypothetical protein
MYPQETLEKNGKKLDRNGHFLLCLKTQFYKIDNSLFNHFILGNKKEIQLSYSDKET